MGQPLIALSIHKNLEFAQPRSRPTIEWHRQDIVSYQVQGAMALKTDDVEGIEATVAKIVRQGRESYLIKCLDGQEIQAERVFVATGVGPERTLQASGVSILTEPSLKRLSAHEVTTAISSIIEPQSFWRDKRVVIYGGGATAAWVAEVALDHSIRDLLWVAERGFAGANPSNRNSEVMRETERLRLKSRIAALRYLGDLSSYVPGDGLGLTVNDGSRMRQVTADVVISATGADPLAPTGILHMLSSDLYQQLEPETGAQQGIFAHTPDNSLFVLSSALTFDRRFLDLIEGRTYLLLKNPENRVAAGAEVTRLSGEDAGSFAALLDKK